MFQKPRVIPYHCDPKRSADTPMTWRHRLSQKLAPSLFPTNSPTLELLIKSLCDVSAYGYAVLTFHLPWDKTPYSSLNKYSKVGGFQRFSCLHLPSHRRNPGIIDAHHMVPGSTGDPGIWTQVLVFARWALYSLRRLPSLTLALLNSAETKQRKEFRGKKKITKVRSSFNKAKDWNEHQSHSDLKDAFVSRTIMLQDWPCTLSALFIH